MRIELVREVGTVTHRAPFVALQAEDEAEAAVADAAEVGVHFSLSTEFHLAILTSGGVCPPEAIDSFDSGRSPYVPPAGCRSMLHTRVASWRATRRTVPGPLGLPAARIRGSGPFTRVGHPFDCVAAGL